MVAVARFTKDAGKLAGVEVFMGEGGKLSLGDGRVVRRADLEAAAAAGKAEIISSLDAASEPEDPSPVPVPAGTPERKGGLIVLVVVAVLVAAAAFAAGFAAGRLTSGQPVLPLLGSTTASVATTRTVELLGPSVTLKALPSTPASPSVLETTPGSVSTSPQRPVVLTGYIKGYDPSSRSGVLLVYGTKGEATPVAYNGKSVFKVGGKVATLAAFAAAATAKSGKPVQLSEFTTRSVSSVSEVLSASEAASLSVDPSAVTLYVVLGSVK